MNEEHHHGCDCGDRKEHCCIRFREAWSAGSIYRPGDAVPYQSSSYVAVYPNQNDSPPSSNWALIAGKGDAGSAGPPGATGPQGPAGISGATEVYESPRTGDSSDTNVGTQGTTVAQISLPAGSYVVMGNVRLSNDDSDQQDYSLTVKINAADIVAIGGRITALGDDIGNSVIVPILTTLTTNTDTTLTIFVSGFSIHLETPKDIRLIAIKVGAIHNA